MAELTDQEYAQILADIDADSSVSMIISKGNEINETIEDDSTDFIYGNFNEDGSSSSFSTDGFPLLPVAVNGDWNESTSVSSSSTSASNLLTALSNSSNIQKNAQNDIIKQAKKTNNILEKQAELYSEQTKLMREIAKDNQESKVVTNKILSKIAAQLVVKNSLDTVIASSTISKNQSDKVLNDSNFKKNNKQFQNIEKQKEKYESDVLTNTKIQENLDYQKNGNGAKNTNGETIKPREAKAQNESEQLIEAKRANTTDLRPLLDEMIKQSNVDGDETENDIMSTLLNSLINDIDATKIDNVYNELQTNKGAN